MGYALKKTAYNMGIEAESVACSFLKNLGYSFIAQRHRNKGGELDLIMRDPDGTIAFIEVKARKKIQDASYAITQKKQKRIVQAALFFIQTLNTVPFMRFDAIWITPDQGHYRITHIPNAWDGTLCEGA